MRLALVTSKNLIITDSPPRTILYTLPLVDFMSFNLVQDLPDFLHGDVQLKSQHISLKFRQDSQVKSDIPLNDSTSSIVSASSDGDINMDKSPKSTKSMRSLAASLSSLSSPSWHGSLSSSQRRAAKLKEKFDLSPDSESRKRLNMSDSGSSVSSWSQDSNHDSPVFLTELDLFLLTDSTLFFQLLQAASLNEKIAGTRRLNILVNGDSKTPKRRKKSTVQCQLYAQLSSDIRTTEKLERRFELVQELLTAVSHDPTIKRYFWKDYDLCRELVEDAGRYRRLRPHTTNNRADEMEYLILLETCLVSMFRESEHLPHRVSLLAANSQDMLRLILENVSLQPHISNHLSGNTEMEGLVDELLDSTISLLFEVLLAVTEHPTYATDLSLSHVTAILETNAPNFVPLYSKIMDRGLSVISRTVSSDTTLTIYTLFYVVEALSRSSAVCNGILRANHLEDIRYYCTNPELRIVRYSPLQTLAIQKVNDLLASIS